MTNPCINLKIVLDKRRQKNDGSYPVKIRATKKEKVRFYNIGYSLTEDQFAKVMGKRPQGKNRVLRELFEKKLGEVKEDCLELEAFSFEAFAKIMKGEKDVPIRGVFSLFMQYQRGLKKQNRVGTYITYKNALSSFKKFCITEPALGDISAEWLRRYEAWMLGQGRSATTIGMYTRAMRAIYNHAIEQGYIDRSHYPFGKGNYTPPTGKNIKKSLSIEQVKMLSQYEPANQAEKLYLDFWLLSYLCNGANIIDILSLTVDNKQQDCIIFYRQKTKRTRRGASKPVVVPLLPKTTAIIDAWETVNPSGRIFPFLERAKDDFEKRKISNEFVKQMNKQMNRIARKLGIDQHITSYTARHTWATVMERQGAPVGIIRDGLGHTSTQTTENYLAGFDKKVLRSFSEKLL